jgi:CRP/FNR family transcriptional regulator, cyclic AMP receptor protein
VSTLQPLLARHPFCRGMDEAQLALLAGCAENVRFPDGAALFRAGEAADASYLLRAGRVSLQLHGAGAGASPLETAEEGELLGWSWLFPPYRWHFDAVAVGAVRALRLDGTCLRNKCEADPAFGFDLARRILYQAQQRLERSRMQALDLYGTARR